VGAIEEKKKVSKRGRKTAIVAPTVLKKAGQETSDRVEQVQKGVKPEEKRVKKERKRQNVSERRKGKKKDTNKATQLMVS